ncbi:uncharacterized protein LOC127711757 [Mytilus californianus]|uniref:uncharacterized protein LOC127711757 n=1 Tax=Mytilus californianus TaxID=6549 RepID=UPI0022455198|nr:uncharacterized protein LOC127711757 [Mytilus californianus]
MVTIYVWNPDAEIGSVGHVSLEVDNNSTYISWYPLNNKTKLQQKATIKKALPSSYEEDSSHFAMRPADGIFRIPRDLVSASKITDWWTHNKPSKQYHLLARNCATVVRDALVVGSRHQVLISLLKLLSWKWSVTPMDIRTYCTIVKKKFILINLDILNILIMLGTLFLIGFATVAFIKLLYVLFIDSHTFSQLIRMCLRIVLILTVLLKYFECTLTLGMITALVLICCFLVYMLYIFLYYSYMILVFISYNIYYWFDFVANDISILCGILLLASKNFSLSLFVAFIISLTLCMLKFIAVWIFYDNCDIIVLLLIVILNIEKYIQTIGQQIRNYMTTEPLN